MAEFIDFLIDEALISITLVVLIVMFIVSIVMDLTKKYIDVDTNKAIDLLDDKHTTILDVRETKERASGYIKNDTHIPMSNVKRKLSTLNTNHPVLVYCRSGNRSAHISSMLTKNGFNQVYNLKGGFNAWVKANLPIVKK